MPVVPIIGVVFSIWLITFLKPETWLRFAIWFAMGLVVYPAGTGDGGRGWRGTGWPSGSLLPYTRRGITSTATRPVADDPS